MIIRQVETSGGAVHVKLDCKLYSVCEQNKRYLFACRQIHNSENN